MILEISVAVIAIAFAALVLFLIRTLHTLQVTLKDTNKTIVEVQRELNEVSTEVKGLIRNTNQITLDVRTKMKALDSLFGTVENVGDTLEGVTSTLRTASNRFMTNVQRNINQVETPENKKVDKVLSAVSSAIDIWKRIRLHRLNSRREAARS
ncbi:DUF948 domain-containing protein [Gorillibacterium timonense]|uniref:DUF948 domain-containing protein n=1 Tax=Gorillibacterium timonense TaxID=1689269 RepID=UPI00071D4E08|nr:DUF948 domain-containing protein [Gorillibacterium timonense]